MAGSLSRVGAVSDFLLELRSEEIPARMQARAREDLAKLFTAELAKAGIAARDVTTYATPRRLAVIARGMPVETAPVSEETKGPKLGAPPQALEGFLRKTGLRQDQLVERDGVYFAVVERAGRATADVLAEAIPAIVRAFPWPKSMRWGAASLSMESLRWVRPLQGIIALLDGVAVPCSVAGIASGRETMGHRFMSDGPISIESAATYVEQLRAAHVIVDQDERANIIAVGAKMAARKAGLTLIEDAGLLAENAGLTEWPVPLLGRFGEAYLSVPPEVIQLTARVNQKYFVCSDAAGKLANAFLCTANIDADDGGAAIVEGNRKVLAARLADARFFFETDLKVPLEEQAAKLDRIVFHEKLGTVADKVARVARLAEWLAQEGIVPGCDPALAARAARLCKADLVTGMVGEFPELQGLMGGYYAAAQGEDPRVAAAIRDHYKPVGQGDEVPTDPVTVAVSLADKLDTIAAFFTRQLRPTGSRDPFALRRAALGVIQIFIENQITAPLGKLVEPIILSVAFGAADHPSETRFVAVALQNGFHHPFERAVESARSFICDVAGWDELSADEKKRREDWLRGLLAPIEATLVSVQRDILDFFADRLKVQQREAGVRHDLIDAVFALGGEDDLVRLLARVRALQAFIGTEDGANLLAGYKRAAKILEQKVVQVKLAEPGERPTDAAEEELESALEAAIFTAEPLVARALEIERFENAMAILASLKASIYAFMDGVLVFHPNADIARHRLDLLRRFRDAVHLVADFSRIEG